MRRTFEKTARFKHGTYSNRTGILDEPGVRDGDETSDGTDTRVDVARLMDWLPD
jgi:hypothetical protein